MQVFIVGSPLEIAMGLDLNIGKTFGELTALSYVGKKDGRKKHYLCRCSCGQEKTFRINNLKNGHTKSCGCLRNRASVKRIDLSGQRFGSLVAVKFLRSNDKGTTIWLCKCDCGNEIEVSYNNLKSGNTQSCGCWHEKHKDSGSRLYKCWQDMKARCCYEGDFNYKNYGGRGIKVCEEWTTSYLKFKDWALSNGYSDELTLDRIDVNGNYFPQNCRWVDAETQQNNRRDNVYVNYNGERLTLMQFANKYTIPKGISYKTLWYRFSMLKWDLHKCLSTPLMNQ